MLDYRCWLLWSICNVNVDVAMAIYINRAWVSGQKSLETKLYFHGKTGSVDNYAHTSASSLV